MKNNGFTLVELLAVVVLMVLVALIVYPKVLNFSEKTKTEISEKKEKLIDNAALTYMSDKLNTYPQNVGEQYCILIETLDNENLIGVDISDVLKKYNYVRIKIGINNNNSYTLVKATSKETCES